ncbi:MAG TPA: DUF3379 family protein [Povalibacter sp.]
MNCLEFRRVVGAEPHSAAAEVAEHAAQCAACARYQQQMQQMDQLIHRALAFDVAAPVDPAAAGPLRDEVRQPQQRKPALQWRLAASLLLAIAAGVFWIGYPRDTLAADLVQHALHEPQSLQRTAQVVSEAEMTQVLAQARVRLNPGMGPVSYAAVCPFRGRRVPHFVVQTAAGPVTVLLLRYEQSVAKPDRFTEGAFQGVIMPAPHGVLAVLGQDAPLEEVAANVLAAVEYEEKS